MSAAIMEAQLVRLINGDSGLARSGCTAQRASGGGVIVRQRNETLGTWRWHGFGFTFTPEGGAGREQNLQTAVEALIFTQNSICARA